MAAKLPPYAVQAGEYVLPKPISGHPALELCNTFAGWDDPRSGNEWLPTYDRLAVWAEFHGLIDSAEPLRHRAGSARAEAVLREVYDLRAAAYLVLRHGGVERAGAFGEIAARADEANALRRLVLADDGSASFALPPGDDPRLPLHAAALATADLLARPERATVRACPGAGCGWLFLDPRGRRVWCSMAACGNRAKVRAHAARQREGG